MEGNTPDRWIKTMSVLGIVGTVLVFTGPQIGSDATAYAGIALLAPLLLGAVIATIAAPLMALGSKDGRVRWNRERSSKEEPPE